MDTIKELIPDDNIDNINETICDKIVTNIIRYLSDDVYVEKIENMYVIKSYNNTLIDKEFIIKLNRNTFDFNLSTSTNRPNLYIPMGNNNKSKDFIFENGNFNIKISSKLFNKHEKWLISKTEDFLYNKISSLEKSLYRNFHIEKKIKRKNVNNIINKKEEL